MLRLGKMYGFGASSLKFGEQGCKETKIWNATLYLRLSRDDGDKEESNSITGQRELLRDFIRTRPELREYAVRIDDGFTGSNFERPSFKKMLEDVKAGRTNCIIVKDLSRFGRNYLDAGEYIEKIFPFLGVRFIAVNDNYDSFGGKSASDELVIPFKNLINEAYCRDISVKVRTQLEVKRKSGQYIGAFAVYGYLKDETDKNHLIVDEYAADIVRDIFSWKLEGMSPQDIATRLNRNGVLSPMEYEKSLGMKFATSFKANPQAAWSANAVLRILKNPVYTGVLIQGKETTPSYKVRKRITKPENEWAVVSDTHEAIIERRDFDSVQKALSLDTRRSPGDSAVQLFSGMVFCGECGASMVRKTVPSGNKKYVYYVCAAHKQDKTCSPHRMRDEALTDIVLETLQQYIRNVVDLDDILAMTDTAPLRIAEAQKVQRQLLEQVRRRQINCIVVKDLSRFGRDYLTVGDYISRVFPFLGVRFISVNDGFDSSNPLDIDSLDTSFRTLIYDLYSRDLSRRVKSAKKARAERGAFLSPYAPYGYVKDPEDKNHLLVDAEAADVIRRIFQMAADGVKPWQIAAALNGDGVSSPKNYKAEAGCTRTPWRSIQEENFWTASLVAKFLRDERYKTEPGYCGQYTHGQDFPQ